MRDTGDMMEDAFSEDTMMECSGDDAGLDDLVDLTDDIAHSAPTIREAAARLLNLLGVEDNPDDDDDDDDDNDDDDNDNDDASSSSSIDEGVELDEDSDENDNDDNNDKVPQNTRLLKQLATSLAKELKYSHKQAQNKSSSTRLSTIQRGAKKTCHVTKSRIQVSEQLQCMDIGQDISCQEDEKITIYSQKSEQSLTRKTSISREFYDNTCFVVSDDESLKIAKYRNDTRHRVSSVDPSVEGKSIFSINTGIAESWTVGWDVCAAEAIRYLVEDEGLSPHHPTVMAMKSHLEIQRERALAQYAV